MELLNDSVIFYGGIILTGLSVFLALISIPVFFRRKRRLYAELDEEYGKREMTKKKK